MLSLLKEKDPYEDIIDVFKKKRNKFVHEAELRDFTENDINMIKGIAQEAIIFLIYDASNLKDIGGLDFFYRNIHTSGEEFKIKTDILKYIEKIKNVWSKESSYYRQVNKENANSRHDRQPRRNPVRARENPAQKLC